MKKILYTIIACIALISCQTERNPFAGEAISIHTAAISRTTDLSFIEADQIGMWFLNTGTEFSAANNNYKDNSLWEYTATGWESNEIVTYPNNGTALDYYAYYPYDANAASTANIKEYPFAVKTDQSIAGNYALSDFLYDSNKTVTTKALNLFFKHKMARITLDIKLGSEMMGVWPEITSIKIGSAATQTNINLSSGAVSTTPTTPTDIIAATQTDLDTDNTTVKGMRAQAIVVPQTIPTGNDFIIIETPSKTYKYTTTASVALNSSESYNLSVTLRENVIVVNSIEITDWTKGWTQTGDLTRAVAYDFSSYSEEMLDFSITNIHICYDNNLNIVGILSKEYVKQLEKDVIILYNNPSIFEMPNNVDINIFPKEGYIISTGQKITFTESEAVGVWTEIGEPPLHFDGVYRTVKGYFVFDSENFILTSPIITPYLVNITRPVSTLGADNKNIKENQTYGVLKIGKQIWLKQNLNVSKLQGGYGLRIAKVGANPKDPEKSETWPGWFRRKYASCTIYGDTGAGVLSTTTERPLNTTPISTLLATREKYGLLYNYHAINAHNETKIETGTTQEDYQLGAPILGIPTYQDWFELMQYVAPNVTKNTRTITNELFEESYPGAMDGLTKAGFINGVYGGHLEFVEYGKLADFFKDIDKEISFWCSDVGVVDATTPENNTAWVWSSTDLLNSSATTHPDFKVSKRFIREGHAVRLMTNLTLK